MSGNNDTPNPYEEIKKTIESIQDNVELSQNASILLHGTIIGSQAQSRALLDVIKGLTKEAQDNPDVKLIDALQKHYDRIDDNIQSHLKKMLLELDTSSPGIAARVSEVLQDDVKW